MRLRRRKGSRRTQGGLHSAVHVRREAARVKDKAAGRVRGGTSCAKVRLRRRGKERSRRRARRTLRRDLAHGVRRLDPGALGVVVRDVVLLARVEEERGLGAVVVVARVPVEALGAVLAQELEEGGREVVRGSSREEQGRATRKRRRTPCETKSPYIHCPEYAAVLVPHSSV